MDLKTAKSAAWAYSRFLELRDTAPEAPAEDAEKEATLESRFRALEERAKSLARKRTESPDGRLGEYTTPYVPVATVEGALSVISVQIGYGFERPRLSHMKLGEAERAVAGFDENHERTTKIFVSWQQTPEGADINAERTRRTFERGPSKLETGVEFATEVAVAPHHNLWREMTPDDLTLLEQSFDTYVSAAEAA